MQIVRQGSYVSCPWKNGGGITREAFRVPADGGDFRWRVSVAQIDASGPFSIFAGYDRKMVLLRGAGLRLHSPGSDVIVLRNPGDLAAFDGDAPMNCELLSGSCTDLNLIVSKALPPARAWVELLTEPRSAIESPTQTTLLMSIFGTLTISGAARPMNLDPWDLGVVWPGEHVTIQNGAQTPAPLAFFATLDDTSR